MPYLVRLVSSCRVLRLTSKLCCKFRSLSYNILNLIFYCHGWHVCKVLGVAAAYINVSEFGNVHRAADRHVSASRCAFTAPTLTTKVERI